MAQSNELSREALRLNGEVTTPKRKGTSVHAPAGTDTGDPARVLGARSRQGGLAPWDRWADRSQQQGNFRGPQCWLCSTGMEAPLQEVGMLARGLMQPQADRRVLAGWAEGRRKERREWNGQADV